MPHELDFLRAEGEEFTSLDEVTNHIQSTATLSNIEGDLSVIGSISDFDTKEDFVESLGPHFSIEQRMGQLFLLNAHQLDVPYYVYLSEEFPIWFTTGRKTEDMPETIDEYLKSSSSIGRMWISKTEMENLRQRVVQNHPDVLMPYFTATRSRHSELPANRRPKYERTIQYYGKDGLDTFNEAKYEYGVLPTNLKFQKANDFKFRVTTRGIFTIKNGGLSEVLTVIEDSIDRLQEVKEAIDTAGFKRMRNQFAGGQTIPESRPWAVQLDSSISQEDIERFEGEELEEWEFNLGRLNASFEGDTPQLKAELIDERTFGKTILRSHDESIRIYPREHTGIDQSVRVFEFISDQLDPNSYATQVA